MNALRFIRDFLLGCTHQRIGWPRARRSGHYVCCLDCGKELSYDWQRMRIGTAKLPKEPPQPHAACVR